MQLCKSVSFKDGEQVIFTTKKNFVIKEPVQDKLLVCIFVCVCEFVSARRTAFPWSWSSAGQQKSLIQNHPGGLLLKRESLAGFAN